MSPAPGPLHALARVGVGSTNPPKLAGVRAALAAFAPAVEVTGVAVDSGVPEQPLGFEEIVRGARNRASAAAAAGDFELCVGYEDGLVSLPTGDAAQPARWFNVGCAAVLRESDVQLGFSSGFAYPPACAQSAARERRPIGSLFDALWRSHAGEAAAPPAPSALSVGNVGKLTAGVLDRAEYTRHAVVCALTAWLHPRLFAEAGA